MRSVTGAHFWPLRPALLYVLCHFLAQPSIIIAHHTIVPAMKSAKTALSADDFYQYMVDDADDPGTGNNH
jgi:hypothetical protein